MIGRAYTHVAIAVDPSGTKGQKKDCRRSEETVDIALKIISSMTRINTASGAGAFKGTDIRLA